MEFCNPKFKNVRNFYPRFRGETPFIDEGESKIPALTIYYQTNRRQLKFSVDKLF